MVESVEHHGKVGKSAHMPNLTLSNYRHSEKDLDSQTGFDAW